MPLSLLFLDELLDNLSNLNKAFQDAKLGPSAAQGKIASKVNFLTSVYLGPHILWISKNMREAFDKAAPKMTDGDKSSFLLGVKTLVSGSKVIYQENENKMIIMFIKIAKFTTCDHVNHDFIKFDICSCFNTLLT